ncbi:MAG TPA: hypothetical protein VFI76_10325 [Terrimicrobiaceae bacterium]|nr:hypothetical protein [Terrimicrobiaceae bacterium]
MLSTTQSLYRDPVRAFLLVRELLSGEPHIRAFADRAGGPQLFEGRDERCDLGVGMHGRGREAHALYCVSKAALPLSVTSLSA